VHQVLESIELNERRRILAHVEEIIVARRLWRHDRLGQIQATMHRQKLIVMELAAPTGGARSASAEPRAEATAEPAACDRAHSSLGMAAIPPQQAQLQRAPLPSFMRPAEEQPTVGGVLDSVRMALRQGSVLRVSGLPWWVGELALRVGFESELGLRPLHVLVCTGKGRRGVGVAFVLLDKHVSLEHDPARVSLSAVGNARLLLHMSSDVCYIAAFKKQQAVGTASDAAVRGIKHAIEAFGASFASAGSAVGSEGRHTRAVEAGPPQREQMSDSTHMALQHSGVVDPGRLDGSIDHWHAAPSRRPPHWTDV
jgi:hypothetical protein